MRDRWTYGAIADSIKAISYSLELLASSAQLLAREMPAGSTLNGSTESALKCLQNDLAVLAGGLLDPDGGGARAASQEQESVS